MLTPAERNEMTSAIHRLPNEVEAAVRGLNDAQLDTPYRKGGWTIRQVVHHLADSHLNAYVRMKLILTEDHPTLKPYDQEEWAKLSDYRLPLEASLAILRGLHHRWTELLNSIAESVWTKSAIHPESGEVTLESLLRTYSSHGKNHVGQITGLRTEKGW